MTKYFLKNYVGIQWASNDVTSPVVTPGCGWALLFMKLVCWQALQFNLTVMWKSPVIPSFWMWQALLLHLDMDGSLVCEQALLFHSLNMFTSPVVPLPSKWKSFVIHALMCGLALWQHLTSMRPKNTVTPLTWYVDEPELDDELILLHLHPSLQLPWGEAKKTGGPNKV